MRNDQGLIIDIIPVVLRQVRKGDDIARLIVVTALVRHPHLDLRDLYTGGNGWQIRHELIVIVTEIMRQEEVTILIILIYLDFERRCLHATFRLHCL